MFFPRRRQVLDPAGEAAAVPRFSEQVELPRLARSVRGDPGLFLGGPWRKNTMTPPGPSARTPGGGGEGPAEAAERDRDGGVRDKWRQVNGRVAAVGGRASRSASSPKIASRRCRRCRVALA